MTDDTITLTVTHRAAIVTLERADYERAKANGTLLELVEKATQDVDMGLEVTEPDGTLIYVGEPTTAPAARVWRHGDPGE